MNPTTHAQQTNPMNHPVSNKTLLKQGVSSDARQQVLTLRREHSLSTVAAMTGLALGTVKTICSRSGSFRDNPALRSLFALPPLQTSTSTALAVPELPPQHAQTGDKEIDAVLWLREVIKTGQAALIEKAMLAAQRIKTPLKEVEDRYAKHLATQNPGNWTMAFQTFGFADLDGLARRSIAKLTTQHEAISRFGSMDHLFANTPGEQFCIEALAGLKSKDFADYNDKQVDQRFNARPELLPNTLSDCLFELAYWHDLYTLRNAVDRDASDPGREAYAREQFVFRSLAHIRPKTKLEAIAVFRYLADSERMDDEETEGILLNLIG